MYSGKKFLTMSFTLLFYQGKNVFLFINIVLWLNAAFALCFHLSGCAFFFISFFLQSWVCVFTVPEVMFAFLRQQIPDCPRSGMWRLGNLVHRCVCVGRVWCAFRFALELSDLMQNVPCGKKEGGYSCREVIWFSLDRQKKNQLNSPGQKMKTTHPHKC